MMEPTPWQPGGERSGAMQQKLATVIRTELASIEDYEQQKWGNWRYVNPGLIRGKTTSADLILIAISWRLRDTISWHKRDAAVFVFSGRALMDQREIDFTGECVRDLASGGFFEFQLITMGLVSKNSRE